MSLDVEEDSPFLFAGDVKVTSMISLGKIPVRRVEELEGMVMKAAGGQMASSVAWVRACINKMVDVELLKVNDKREALEKLLRAAGR